MPSAPATSETHSRLPDRLLRTFFAAWPDAGVCTTLAAHARDIAAKTEGRAPVAANLHLTLAFVGDVAASRVAALYAIGGVAAAAGSPFTLTLDCGGMFRAVGIAWIGASVSPERLQRLVDGLGIGLSAQGFAIERRAFLPHITLARRCRRPGDFAVATPIRWTIARIALYASESTPDGSRYRELAAWPLEGRVTAD